MDIRMPGMNGYQATEILKNDKRTAHIRVIALTASTMASETERINTLFDGYLRKPVQRNSLLAELMKHLQHDENAGEKTETKYPEAQEIKDVLELSESLKAEFRSAFFAKTEALESMMIIEEMDNFADAIGAFANQHNLLFLKQHAELLKKYISEFEFDKISDCIADIKKCFI